MIPNKKEHDELLYEEMAFDLSQEREEETEESNS